MRTASQWVWVMYIVNMKENFYRIGYNKVFKKCHRSDAFNQGYKKDKIQCWTMKYV